MINYKRMPYYPNKINYDGEKFKDKVYEYWSIILTKEHNSKLSDTKLLSYSDMVNLGLNIEKDWEHYMIHPPERHVILLRRKI